jgi:small subunit ribosomal protein S1
MDFRSVSIEELRNRTEVPEDQAVTSVKAGEDSFAELFEGGEASRNFRVGDIVKGRVLSVTKDFVVVDIGYKSEGQIPIEEFRDAEGKVTVSSGQEVEVYVDQAETEDELVELSKDKADKLQGLGPDQRSLRARRTRARAHRGSGQGWSVRRHRREGLPPGQPGRPPPDSQPREVHRPGVRLQGHQVQQAPRQHRAVAPRPARAERAELKAKTLERLEEGRVLDGVVKNITEYGAFVDLGGIDGLLHITDMSWGRVNHPSEMFRSATKSTSRSSSSTRDRARQPRPQADQRRSVGPRRGEVQGRRPRQRQGRQPDRLRRLRRARRGHRRPDPHLRDELDEARQAPLEDGVHR